MSDTTNNTPRDAAADLAVCAAATPGPWDAFLCHGEHRRPVVGVVKENIRVADIGSALITPEQRDADAALVALARTALPHWIERATAAEAEVARLRAMLAVAAKPCPLSIIYG